MNDSHVVTAEEYVKLPRSAATWLVQSLLPVGGSALLYGDPKVGKSFAALQLAGHLTRGEDWLGFQCQPSRVLYIQLDTPRSLWAERIDQLGKTPMMTPQALFPAQPVMTNASASAPWSLEDNPCSGILMADRETLDTWPFDILNPAHQKLISTVCQAIEPAVVILDTIREAHSADENDSTGMQAVIAHLTAAVKPAALILIAHARKTNFEAGPDIMNDNRGSNYLVGKMDCIMRFGHNTVRVAGRALDEQSIAVERLDNGFWGLAVDPTESLAMDLLKTHKPIRELARILHETSGKSESAARAYLRRLQLNRKTGF